MQLCMSVMKIIHIQGISPNLELLHVFSNRLLNDRFLLPEGVNSVLYEQSHFEKGSAYSHTYIIIAFNQVMLRYFFRQHSLSRILDPGI